MPATYPSAQHIEVALKSGGFWPEDTNAQEYARFQAAIAADGAAAQFENETGWEPTLAGFLPDGEIPARDADGKLLGETRYFDGGDHNGDLDLQGGLLRLDSVSIGGTVQSRDYAPYLHRFSRSPQTPIIAIRRSFGRSAAWGSGYGAGGNSIAITGVWGRFLSVPADVFLAVQQRAIARMMDLIENEQSIGSISQDGFSKSFDITGIRTQQNIAESGSKDFNTLVANYMRPILG